jgi:ABC-2 type transport system ATP-binding protein
MISLSNVSKFYGAVRAVDGITLEIGRGEIVGFIGPNGAGKSTTMRMITGFMPPTSGKLTVGGVDAVAEPKTAKAKIGYLPESAAVYTDMEVTDFLRFMGKMHGLPPTTLRQRLKVVICQCQIEKVLGRKINTLSKGYRQRVGLAQALLHDPEILILDEPTVGLDPNQIIDVRGVIREISHNKTILLSTHILSEVEAICQRIVLINEGRVVAQGTLAEMRAEHGGGSLEEVFIKLTKTPVTRGNCI